jgi:hypothetical protein
VYPGNPLTSFPYTGQPPVTQAGLYPVCRVAGSSSKLMSSPKADKTQNARATAANSKVFNLTISYLFLSPYFFPRTSEFLSKETDALYGINRAQIAQ